ncbi:PREDICTED: uncharacterized protein LOC105451650 [Wasmannia auropunctata]|uniref:uncharacterized protein LOC105451650 n=1 Tax=Wasmannia auropunctata TaxID=64793 RepID=UPI0005EFC9FB|nr:PREDICTED: uncharacterized protein LOC105451650 [Wasmannia auropunctata]
MEDPMQKKIHAKEKPCMSKNDDVTTQNNENTLDLSTVLTYDILRIIFQYLDARDLANAAMVCRFWLEAANNEKLTRGHPCYFTQFYDDYDRNGRHELLCYINRIRIKPSIGFFFMRSDTPRNIYIEECTEALLPKDCEAIMLYSEGIIVQNCQFPNITCVFLPQIPNVKIKSFILSENYIIQETAEYREIISTIVNNETSTLSDKTSTCFMLFCNGKDRTTAQRWASAIQEISKECEAVSVWGGVMIDIHAQRAHTDLRKRQMRTRSLEKMNTFEYCVAVLITGPIWTWSVILEWTCNTNELIEARLKLFKNKVKLKKHSIGFMIMSEPRESSYLEPVIFTRLFPEVRLVGCISYGEFGKNTAVNEMNEERNSKFWYNDLCTVFLILTYG